MSPDVRWYVEALEHRLREFDGEITQRVGLRVHLGWQVVLPPCALKDDLFRLVCLVVGVAETELVAGGIQLVAGETGVSPERVQPVIRPVPTVGEPVYGVQLQLGGLVDDEESVPERLFGTTVGVEDQLSVL